MTDPIRAWHLPGFTPGASSMHVLEADGFRAEAPVLTADELDALCTRVAAAGAVLRAAGTERIILAVDAAAAWIDLHAESLAPAVAAFTRTSPQMAVHVIRRMSMDWRSPALHRLVEAEFGTGDALQPPGAAGRSPLVRARAIPPRLGLHVFSGNVAGVSVTSLVRALLVRSPVIGKAAAGEPVLPAAFAHALAAADPALADALAVTYWKGGDATVEAAVLRRVDQVVHYGGADAVAALRARAPERVHFVEHGPKVSVAVVGADAALELVADHCAYAVATFDQQGCVSPQEVCVIGDPARAFTFAETLAGAMDRISEELPPGRPSAGEAAAIRELRTRAEFADMERVRLWEGAALAWTVVCTTDDGIAAGSCLNRTVIVRTVPDADAFIDHVAPLAHLLQTVGADGFDAATFARLSERVALAGATRVCAIRDMPWPPATWHHDGRGPLRELVRWADVETRPG